MNPFQFAAQQISHFMDFELPYDRVKPETAFYYVMIPKQGRTDMVNRLHTEIVGRTPIIYAEPIGDRILQLTGSLGRVVRAFVAHTDLEVRGITSMGALIDSDWVPQLDTLVSLHNSLLTARYIGFNAASLTSKLED